jgi:asparaginyl-tRNA synthetase
VHRFRSQKDVIFVILAHGYGQLQCVFSGDLIRTYTAMTLIQQTSFAIHGEMRKVPRAQHAPLDHELHVDYFTVMGVAAGDHEAITNKVQEGADPQTLLENRHLVMRGDKASSVMKVRAAVLRVFRRTHVEQGCLEVTPPCMVQTQVKEARRSSNSITMAKPYTILAALSRNLSALPGGRVLCGTLFPR